jgi:hypothetical protein
MCCSSSGIPSLTVVSGLLKRDSDVDDSELLWKRQDSGDGEGDEIHPTCREGRREHCRDILMSAR